jgi:NAD(P)-dependent dehydrogenase (short-subunit alcohol dehydrogenase family)
MGGIQRVAGRRFLVTGAAGGMGQAAVASLRAEGAAVAMLDLYPNAEQATTAAACADLPPALAIACDVSDEASVTRAVDRADEWLGGIDGVVNAAGIFRQGKVEAADTDQWRQVLAVNLLGPMLVCRAAIPAMTQSGGGTIVNIASIAAIKPAATSPAYGASKAGLVAFSKSLAQQVGPGIRVNTICPGAVNTPMIGDFVVELGQEQGRLPAQSIIGRLGTPEEIASVILFLSCPESSLMIGSTIVVDGGHTWF